MARAKRTNRAAARRKYRAYLQSLDEAAAAEAQESEESEEAEEAAGSKPSRSRVERPRPVPQPGVRMGIFDALRAAYRKPTYISDLKYFPTLVGRTHAIWPVLAISAVSCAYATNAFRGDYHDDPILPWIFSVVFYPPLVPPMVAGYLAPRATWLAGLVASFVATMGLIVAIAVSGVKFTNAGLTSPSPAATATQVENASATLSSGAVATSTPSPTATAAPSGSAASPSPAPSSTSNGATSGTTGGNALSELMGYAVLLLFQSMAIGAMIGALSGWYKRFLELTAGPRKPKSRSQGGRRPQQRRPAAPR